MSTSTISPPLLTTRQPRLARELSSPQDTTFRVQDDGTLLDDEEMADDNEEEVEDNEDEEDENSLISDKEDIAHYHPDDVHQVKSPAPLGWTNVGQYKSSKPPGSVTVRKSGMGKLERLPISDKPLDHLYKRIKTIDDGAGNLGGMNAGVHIVRAVKTGQVYVQKCYRSKNAILIKLFRDEIGYMRRLMHSSIVQYVDAYVNIKSPYEAAAYMEYCDRGSLRDMIKLYQPEKKKGRRSIHPRELHLACVLRFGGRSILPQDRPKFYLCGTAEKQPHELEAHHTPRYQTRQTHKPFPREKRMLPPEFEMGTQIPPLLTPETDIFLRSRDTPNSRKPPYVLLSDFGVACFEDKSSAGSGPCPAIGTFEYHAPELCFDPFPTKAQTNHQQAGPHTGRSDVFAVALLMYCLCERAPFQHIDPRSLPLRSTAALGRESRYPVLVISARGRYSDYLARVIDWAGKRDPADRPEAPQLVEGVLRQCQLWKADENWQNQVAETLPDWAAPKRTV
ncbi:kinase-like protein [Apiospora arundinis]